MAEDKKALRREARYQTARRNFTCQEPFWGQGNVCSKMCKSMTLSDIIDAFYRRWRLMAIDGTTFDFPDEQRSHDFWVRPP